MTDIIFIPGLGADERMFGFIEIRDCKKHFVKWVKPDADESLQSYVSKIKSQVSSCELPVLIGVSLGGIIAMELREMMPVKKTIIISSIKIKTEMPGYFSWIRRTGLNEMLPPSFLKKSAPLVRPFVSGATNENSYRIFKEMLFDTDETFISWGIRKVLRWERTTYEKENLVHIHGTSDLVFPIRNITNCDYKIKGGPHNIVMHRPAEINEILEKEIQAQPEMAPSVQDL